MSNIKINSDVKHGWNSIYELLNKDISRKEVLSEFCAFHAQEYMISDTHWELCQQKKKIYYKFLIMQQH